MKEAVKSLTPHEKERLLAVTDLLKVEFSSRSAKGIAWEIVTELLTFGWDPTTVGAINKCLNPDGARRWAMLDRVTELENALRARS